MEDANKKNKLAVVDSKPANLGQKAEAVKSKTEDMSKDLAEKAKSAGHNVATDVRHGAEAVKSAVKKD